MILGPNWALLGTPMGWLMASYSSGLAVSALLPAQGGPQTEPLRVRKAPDLAAAAQVPAQAIFQTGSPWLRQESSLSGMARISVRGGLQKGCLQLWKGLIVRAPSQSSLHPQVVSNRRVS